MASQNFLIMNLLRLITPEEIGDIATRHNGGKFLSLTDLVNERVEHSIYRDFSNADSLDMIHEDYSNQAKILPFKKPDSENASSSATVDETDSVESVNLSDIANEEVGTESNPPETKKMVEHKENENMSSFILIEKERLKRSQFSLKQKEIIDLYQKNSHVDVEQIKGSNNNLAQSRESGVLVNKKQY
jgi:hypothetical protein